MNLERKRKNLNLGCEVEEEKWVPGALMRSLNLERQTQ